MLVNLTELHPAEYVVPGFFDEQPSGLYALQLAHGLGACGVAAQEWVAASSALAAKLEPYYQESTVPDEARAAIRDGATQFERRCPPVADLLTRAADTVTRGKNLAALIVHLGRVGNQLSLLELARPAHA